MLYSAGEANAEAVMKLIPAFKQKFGIDLVIDSQAQPGLQTKVFAELASGSDAYDILVADTTWMPALVGKLEPLSGYLNNAELNTMSDLDFGDFIPKVLYDTSVYDRRNVLLQYPEPTSAPVIATIQGKGFDVFSLPIQANVLVQAYRKDLFDDPQQQAAYQAKFGKPLEVPKTLDDYRQVAKFFTQPTKGLYGTTVMAGVGSWSTDDFKTLVSAFGGEGRPVAPDLSVNFTSPEAVQALSYYRSLITDGSVPPGSTSADWNTVADSFDSGKTAMTQNYHNLALNDGVKGSIGYAEVPAGKGEGPHFGTWGLALNSKSKNKAWAYRAMAWLTAAEQQSAMTKSMLHPTRTSVYEDVESQTDDPSLGEYYVVLGRALAKGVGVTRLTNYPEVEHAIGVAVNEGATGKKNPKTALEDGAKAVTRLITEAGIKAGG